MSELVTGEAIVLELRPARAASRGLAFAIDGTLQLILAGLLLWGATEAADAISDDGALVAATSILALVIAFVGYPVISEVTSRGKSLGKWALGLRVVRDDGGSTRFRHALVRALAGLIEIWISFGSIALIASLSSSTGKRLGDQFAGTFVILERLPTRFAQPAQVDPWLATWAGTVDLAGVSDELAERARQFAERARGLAPDARLRLANALANELAPRISPQPPTGTPAESFVTTVVAERARRAAWRFSQQGPAAAQSPAAPPLRPPAPQPPQSAPPHDNAGDTNPGGFAPPA